MEINYNHATEGFVKVDLDWNDLTPEAQVELKAVIMDVERFFDENYLVYPLASVYLTVLVDPEDLG
jgi:hypothetical protein